MSLIKNYIIFTFEFVSYLLFKQPSVKGYQSMINLFCLTGGASNDFFSKVISMFNYKKNANVESNLFGVQRSGDLDEIVEDINENGFHISKYRLPDKIIQEIVRFSKENKAKIRLMDDEIKLGKSEKGLAYFDAENLQAIRYDYMESDLINNKIVQDLMGDEFFVEIANRYLNSNPIIDITALWWHTNYSKNPDDNAATMYHFDMDRIKWLKVFIYITDVGPDNGPHCYVKGTNRTGSIPQGLLKKGYQRLTDDEVCMCYNSKDILEFAAPRGTIIFEDTRGLHKGKHVLNNPRLIFQLEFTNSLFGSKIKDPILKSVSSNSLKSAFRKYNKLLNYYI
ncbi:MAG: hypothetical protein L6Q33_07825 [Bacteriovoracaceae bacterium]|nr:hypothetical protein [Bacteriovoracaceae bacterium]